jgi:hypothetical protein
VRWENKGEVMKVGREKERKNTKEMEEEEEEEGIHDGGNDLLPPTMGG